MSLFTIARTETIAYWYEYGRPEVIDILTKHWSDGEDYAAMSDEELRNVFQEAIDGNSDVGDRVIEQSERFGDVQGNEIEVLLREEVKNEG